MTPRAWITHVTFSDNSTIQLGKSDIIVVVGPNNAGKSAALRAVRDKLASNLSSPVVSAVGLEREGTPDDVVAWLDSFTQKHEPLAPDPVFQAFGVGIHGSQVRSQWQQSGTRLQNLSRFFCHLLTADERLQAANPVNS